MTDLHTGSRSGRLDAALQALLTATPELEAAAVVSFDGLPMASALPPGMDEDRVAAMSAALLSLGERAAMGLGRGELSQVYVEGEDGTVFLVSAEDTAVLVAVAARGAKIGMMLYEVKRAAADVAAVLRPEPVASSTPVVHGVAPTPAPYAPPVYAPTYTEPRPSTYEPAPGSAYSLASLQDAPHLSPVVPAPSAPPVSETLWSGYAPADPQAWA